MSLKLKTLTTAEITTLAASNGLLDGELIFLSDSNTAVVAVNTSSYTPISGGGGVEVGDIIRTAGPQPDLTLPAKGWTLPQADWPELANVYAPLVIETQTGDYSYSYWSETQLVVASNGSTPKRIVVASNGMVAIMSSSGRRFTYTFDDFQTYNTLTLGSGSPNGLVFGNNYWVSTYTPGPNIQVCNSDPTVGANWIGFEVRDFGSFNNVAYGNGIFVSVGSGNTSGAAIIYTATNPMSNATWTLRASGTPNNLDLYDVVMGGATWVAVGESGNITTATSTAATWTLRTSGVTGSLRSVAYGNGTFVAVGGNGNVVYSTTGTSWTVKSLPWVSASKSLWEVLFTGERWIFRTASSLLVTDGPTMSMAADDVTEYPLPISTASASLFMKDNVLRVASYANSTVMDVHRTKRLNYDPNTHFALPNIPDSRGTRAYIKAESE